MQIPENGLNHLADRLLLFRHDYNSPNVLQIINSAAEIVDETLVEIVLTANCEYLKRFMKILQSNMLFFTSSCRLR